MKKAVLHTTTMMHCKARQVLRNLFSTNQGNGSEMTYVAGAIKVSLISSQISATNLLKIYLNHVMT